MILIADHASLAFQPLIDLSDVPYANLSSQAATYWLNLDSDPNQLGAFMYFYGPTRKLLKAGGLNLSIDNYSHLNTTNEKWNQLIEKRRLEATSRLEELYFIRLLYYLGFYDEGIRSVEEIFSSNDADNHVTMWAQYLKELGYSLTQPLCWNPSQLVESAMLIKDEGFSVLNFEIYMLISKFFIRYKKDAVQGKYWLEKIKCLVDMPNSETIDIVTARYQKYLGDWHVLNLQDGEAKIQYELALDSFNEKNHYLALETKRRILDALAFLHLRNNAFREALEVSRKSLVIDPYCSYAQVMGGSIAFRNENFKQATACFKKGALFGVIERPYSIFNLSRISISALQASALKQDAGDNNWFESSELPIALSRIQSVSDQLAEGLDWAQVKNQRFYQSFLPFWELRASNTDPAIASNIPLFAFETFKEKKQPWYETLYHQRTMPGNFREELFFSASPHMSFAQIHLKQATSLSFLNDLSPKGEWLVDQYKSLNSLSKLESVHFCRLLGSLGFYQVAISSLPHIERTSEWSHEDEYAFCTKIFLENVWDKSNLEIDLEFAYNKLSNVPQSLRLRLNLTILGMVFYGQKSNISSLKKWRDRGFLILAKIQEGKEFVQFEKDLLTSRFYRAASYYPYLIHDHRLLISEAVLCEDYARKLTPVTSREQMLKRENLFPMLESMSRIYFQVGEKNKALSLMEEIISEVDPYDSKAWLQVGDLREKLGLIDGAKEAFQAAANLGAPLGGLIWFRIGRISEKTDDLEWAKYAYMRSLKFNPMGISSFKRLQAISDDAYSKEWCARSLKYLEILGKK